MNDFDASYKKFQRHTSALGLHLVNPGATHPAVAFSGCPHSVVLSSMNICCALASSP